jgi:hypothetical protein
MLRDVNVNLGTIAHPGWDIETNFTIYIQRKKAWIDGGQLHKKSNGVESKEEYAKKFGLY